ncbi:MAG: ATP-binding cassette domain-containing protein [Deltaproteobacteria bacterium]|nr:ATP-binding cassette domain-containing protein [Deltaproteobacteria bacterium]
MISTSDLSFAWGSSRLFEDVNIRFTPGNCYGVIGANGAGKSTFLKILAGEIEPSRGAVIRNSSQSLSMLRQDHFRFNEEEVLQAVLMGHQKLIDVMHEKDALYAKADFSEEDGVRAAELEADFASLGGWEAESEAATLLDGLGIAQDRIRKKVRELRDSEKVRVLLAQALFGNPDILLLDEPTNHLDAKSIIWLENFLQAFNNTVIVISHDRHFLNKVCTHTVDIDYRKVQLYAGNYDFWKESSTLARNLRAAEHKRSEEKAKELETFIRRFSANAAKSKQATSRKKLLDKLSLDDLPASVRKYPHVVFEQERELGDLLLEVEGLSKTLDGEILFSDLSFQLNKNDKTIFVGRNELATTALMEILSGRMAADSGTYKWGVTTSRSYLPLNYEDFFDGRKENLIDWLREFSEDKSENFIRSFLGRMLFSGEETRKSAEVLSGGEKVRCMLARMMLQRANVVLLDGPTNHLDLESITSLNQALLRFGGAVLLVTHDHEFAETVSNRVLEVTEHGIREHQGHYQDYLDSLMNPL